MRTMQIKVEGANGEATFTRSGAEVVIEGKQLVKAIDGKKSGKVCLKHEAFRMALGVAADSDTRNSVARILHRRLEGYNGTNGDVDDYQRVIDKLAD